MSAITTATMQVLWNGVPTEKFKPARGVRQGCLLSPYLFVLCMEWLGHSFQTSIASKDWLSIKLSRNGPSLSHLFFADDLVRTNLCNWYAKQLSMVGSFTLVQSVLLTIPNYFIQSMKISKGVCDEIERLTRQFI
ncbi:hypothetical protein J1N35_007362 [Gossypium stocksii]|uniref:Reverse transcriptase domain-containing protein n=1 Tax=Gossypium stocksii TaxID=47602 RepID=A0A9D4AF72_9ROSI|nr:hypothetical protein J1N35_007362 [Gossypium stocksii]